MTVFLRVLLSLSVSGSVLALLLLALRPLLRGRVGRGLQYFAWLLVAARLLLPVSLPLNAVGALFRAEPFAPGVFAVAPESGAAQGTAPPEAPAPSGQPASPLAAPAPDAPGSALPLAPTLAAVWAAGFVFLLLRRIVAYRRFLRAALTDAHPATTSALFAAFGRACRALELHRPPTLLICPHAGAPMLVGVLHPTVLLPSEALSEGDAYRVLLHELAHCKRRDFLCKWAYELAVCVHWFNPLVRLARGAAAEACELACDETVLRALAPEERRAYGDTLLRLARPAATPSPALALGEDAKKMKERLVCIMSFPKEPRRVRALSAGFICLLVVSALLLGCTSPFAAAQSSKPADERPRIFRGVFETHANAKPFQTGEGERVFPAEENSPFWLNYYYENGYLMAIGWNVDTAKYAQTRSVTFGESACTVSFSERMRAYADDAAVLEAIRLAYGEILSLGWTTEDRYAPRALALTALDGPFAEDPDTLLARFYEEDNQPYFCAVARAASDEAKAVYARRSIADGHADFFSMTKDALPQAECYTIAQTAVEQDDMAVLSIVMDRLSEQQIAQLAELARKDKNIAAYSVLTD